MARRPAAKSVQSNRARGTDAKTQQGQVVANYGRVLALETDTGKLVSALPLRRLGYIACGDRVEWIRQPDGQAVATGRLPRSTSMERIDARGRFRLLASNFDRLVIVAADPPGFDDRLIDNYLVMAAHLGVSALLALNKSDLLHGDSAAEAARLTRIYSRLDCPVAAISTHTAAGLDPLLPALDGHVSILVGQSGVGKSSIVGRLLPERAIRVGELSRATGLGSHTTTTTILYRLPDGGSLIDSPGVREFALDHLPVTSVMRGFSEIQALADGCRFHNCQHDREPDCAVSAAAAAGQIESHRYRNYLTLLSASQAAAIERRY